MKHLVFGLEPSGVKERRTISLAWEEWEPHFLERIRLNKIKHGQCRWPYGEMRDSTFGFCGLPVRFNSSYCEGHHRRAHNPPKEKLQ